VTGPAAEGSPYAGLRHYTEADAAFFFGREAERDVVIANLLASRLTLLYGESGVGKSSLLHAGVARTLRARSEEAAADDDPRLAVVVFADWSAPDPVRRLIARVAEEVDRLAVGQPLPSALDVDLGAALAELGERLGGELLIVLDQFEESFLYHGQDGEASSMATQLPRALRRDDTGANFLISIREDQLARLDRFKGRIPNLFDNYLRVEHLDREAAREAIVRPIEELNRLHGSDEQPFGIEDELVDRVLVELEAGKVGTGGATAVDGGEPRIETPYLQLVLTRLWEEERRRGSRTLRAETLADLGGAGAIVRRHLDDALGTLGAKEQAAAARLFHYLVTPSGTKIAHHRADLAAYAGLAEGDTARLLERLAGETRILRPVGEESYEIYHDVLAAAVLDWGARVQARELARERRLRRRWRSLAASIAAVAVGLGAYAGDFLAQPELKSVDVRFAIRGDRSAPEDVVVVAIDTRTFERLKIRWPFDRTWHARAIDRLRTAGATAIAYDLQFTEPSPGESGARADNALIEAVARAGGRIALAATEFDELGRSNILGGDPLLREIAARAGNTLVPPDRDGTVRRLPFAIDGVKTLAVVSAEIALRRPIARREAGPRTTWIDFAGDPGTITTLSFSDVVRGSFDPARVRGRVAVVGPAAPSLQDLHATPVGDGLMSGAELQANAIETALHGFPLRSPPAWVGVVAIVALGLVAVFASLLPALPAFVTALGVGALYLLAAQIAFQAGTVVLVVYPLVSLLLAAFVALAIELASRT
jgi:CHASE2 domain-containing sensor protein